MYRHWGNLMKKKFVKPQVGVLFQSDLSASWSKMIMNQYGGKIPERLIELKKFLESVLYSGSDFEHRLRSAGSGCRWNVMRVFSRIFEIPDDITQMQTRKRWNP